MKKTILMCLVISINSFAQVSYSTFCKIKDGRAYGSVNNYENSFEIDGNVWFHFYDSQGRLIDSEDEYEYEYVSSSSSEEIEYTAAPTNACSCNFDIKTATKEGNYQNTFDQPSHGLDKESYSTTCEIRNGTAYGNVNNYENSFEIDGNVWFHFYDSQGRLINSEDEYEYEYVSSKSWEEIEYTTAPANACKCDFEIKKAIRR